MNTHNPTFKVSIAQSDRELRSAQRLRYEVFVAELDADGPMTDHADRLEKDRFDEAAVHFLLSDLTRPADDQVVGVYRVMTSAAAKKMGQFYCEDEYDLTRLRQSGLRLLELGRSCLHPDYRGGAALMHLWSGLADYVAQNDIELLFGVASFQGTNMADVAAPLSLLHARHLAPDALRATAKLPGAQPMNILPLDGIDRITAMRDTPSLIKSYLRLGGVVGDGAYIDHAFNTIDVCMILRTGAVGGLQRQMIARGAGLG